MNIDPENTNVPNGTEPDADKECERYEKLIESMGGVDIQLLGLGHNGHIGFNEPDSAFAQTTHCVDLTESTIEANKRFFASADDVPRQAYTMGIGTIMRAKKILLIVNGEAKADIVAKAFFGPVTPEVPASILQLHNDVVIVGDKAALSQAGGADRIELCSGLVIGGLSPSVAMFEQVKKNVDIPVRVLLRPRFGDFCYDGYEFETLKEEVCLFREAGADGVVIGILKPDGRLDTDRMKELVECAKSESKSGKRPCAVTFHRAFDVCRSPYEALRQCIELGIDTILTSGQKDSAWNGRELLKELVREAAGEIEILAGAGISPEVIGKLADYAGVTSFHMSGKKVTDSKMEFRREDVPMGIPGFPEFDIWQTDAGLVGNAKRILIDLQEESLKNDR